MNARRSLPFGDVEGIRRYAIHVGDIFASDECAVVETLLGSCVSVCLYDRNARVGGMNHILLPGRANLETMDDAARYGINAMELLVGKVQNLGAARKRLEAKVFGGAVILGELEKRFNPGNRNGEFAIEFLRMEGIPVVARDIGGTSARRIYLRTDTGEVLLRRIPTTRTAEVLEVERAHQEKVRQQLSRGGRITLFDK
jgi:chemotaxis protein CheD